MNATVLFHSQLALERVLLQTVVVMLMLTNLIGLLECDRQIQSFASPF